MNTETKLAKDSSPVNLKLNFPVSTQDTLLDAEFEEDQLLLQKPKLESSKEPNNTRWLVLMLSIIASFGCFYCNDNPQPLQSLIEEIFQIRDAKFNTLNSITLIPSAIAPFIGGILIDSVGFRITMIIFLFAVNIGQLIIVIGAKVLSFEFMIIGRFIFGIGFLTIHTGLIVMVTKWFATKDFTLAWGLARAFLRTASALNSFLTPKIYTWTNELYAPFLFGLVLTLTSLVAMFLIAYIDKKAEKQHQVEASVTVKDRIKFKDIKELPKIFCIMMVLSFLVYGSFQVLVFNVNNMLVQRFGFNPVNAGSLITILYLIAAVSSPFIGIMTDKVGKRVIWIMLATFLIFVSQLSFIILEDMPQGQANYRVIATFICIGLFYGLFSTIFWTSISLVVKFQVVGTANGIVNCINSLYQAIFTEVLGTIHDNTLEVHKGYHYTQVLQCGLLGIAFMFSIWLYFEDIRTGGRLNKAKVDKKDS